MQKSRAVLIIAKAMRDMTNDTRYHSVPYAEKCYQHLTDLYAIHGFEHMPALILQAIENDSRCVYSIALELKA